MSNLIERAALAVAQAAAIRLALWAGGWLLRRTIAMVKQLVGEKEFLTAAEVAEKLGLRASQVTRVFERGFLPPAARLGRVRMIPASDVEKVREAARRAGYLD